MVTDDWPPIWPTMILPKIFQFRFSVDMEKMIDPPICLTRISPKIFQLRFSLDIMKNDHPPVWLTRISPKIFQFRFSQDMMGDDEPTPSDCSESHLKFFSSDLVWRWGEMINPPIWLTRIWPKIFQFRFSVDMVGDDQPSPSDWPGSDLKFFSSDLAWTWWKMIDPHQTDQDPT